MTTVSFDVSVLLDRSEHTVKVLEVEGPLTSKTGRGYYRLNLEHHLAYAVGHYIAYEILWRTAGYKVPPEDIEWLKGETLVIKLRRATVPRSSDDTEDKIYLGVGSAKVKEKK